MKTILMVLMMLGISACGTPQGQPKTTSKGYILVLLGAPGSGKGTQAVDLAQKLGIPHISLGDLLRANKANGTPLGQKAAEYMDKGLLVPDSLAIEVLAARVSEPDAQKGYILDGFPRTLDQAEELQKSIMGDRRLIVVNLDVPDVDLIKRLGARGRADDTPEVIEQRLKVYHAQTAPLIAFYQRKGVLLNINGSKTKEAVLADIVSQLNQQGITVK